MTTIENILDTIRLSRSKSSSVVEEEEEKCEVCHGPDLFKREEEGKRYFCSHRCNKTEFWYSELFQLGFKRKLEWSDVRRTIFSDLPPEIQGYVILLAYRYRIESMDDWNLLMKLRNFHFDEFPGEGNQLEKTIDDVVIPNLQYVNHSVLFQSTLDTVKKFKGLVELRMQFDEKSWERVDRHLLQKTGVMTPHPYGDWTEVLIGMKSLRKFSDANLRAKVITFDITRLTQIKKLETSYINDTSLGKLTQLESLSLLSSERVTDASIALLINLRSLTLDSIPRIDGKDSLQNLHMLTKLKLIDRNRRPDNILERVTTQLKSLTLDVTRIEAEALREMVRLERLVARSSSLETDMTDDILKGLTNLTELDISGQIDREYRVNVETLVLLPKLKSLVLDSTHVNVNIYGLHNLTNIQSLSLRSSYAALNKDIQDLTNLKSLDIASNRIGNYGILKLTNLTRLGIQKNDFITENALMKLAEYRNLKVIYSSPNYKLENLKAVYPQVVVITDGHFPKFL